MKKRETRRVENPASWTPVMHAIDKAMDEWETTRKEHPDIVGGSEVLAIYLALKKGGYLKEESTGG